MSLAEVIEREYREVVPSALKRERRSAKVIALNIGTTPRTVENWRDGSNGMQVQHFFALAKEIPELRKMALRWLDADNGGGEDTSRVIEEIRKLMERR